MNKLFFAASLFYVEFVIGVDKCFVVLINVLLILLLTLIRNLVFRKPWFPLA